MNPRGLDKLSSEYEIALHAAIRNGLMSEGQYRAIAEYLRADPSGKLLVFGIGHDAFLWWHCVCGRIAYVEDNPMFLTMAPAGARSVLLTFPTRRGAWSIVPPVPPLIDRPWDFVLVDGPTGYHPSSPGRQIPIAWAKTLASRAIFVHDYERPWERELCDAMLGSPAQVLASDSHRRGDLAIFEVANGRE